MKKIAFIFILSLYIGLCGGVSAQEGSTVKDTKKQDLIFDSENSAIDISIAKKDVLSKSSKVQVMEALFGQISGLNVTQGSGYSYERNPSYNLQGLTPLILIDGVPRDLNSIVIDEVEDVIVYKDAVAAALYGVRGGRGVINIITQKGKKSSKLQMVASYQFGAASKFRSPDFADSYTYGKALNKALISDGFSDKYSVLELDAFKNGTYPDVYANVDWYDEVFSKFEYNHQFTFKVTGGKEKFDYFAVISYSRNEGLFKHASLDDRFDNRLLDTRLNVRTNFRVDVTNTTEFRTNIQAQLKEYNGPNSGNTAIQYAYKIPAAAFPIKTNGIWGGNTVYTDNNPVAILSQNGHYKNTLNTLNFDVNLKQDFSFVTPGLSASILFALDNYGKLYETSHLSYRYQDLNPSILSDGSLVTNPVIYGSDSQTLWHGSGINDTYFDTYLTGSVNYKHTFDKNNIDASLIYNMQTNNVTGQNESRKRQSVAVYGTYNYDTKYFVDAVVNYGGASEIQLGDRFDIYPAISGAWLLSKEDFFNLGFINYFKLKGSYGYSAYDSSIPYDLEKSYYSSGKDGYVATGSTGSPISKSGWGESSLPVSNLQLEKMRKATIGADIYMVDSRLYFSGNAFFNKRYNILLGTASTTSGVLGIASSKQNDGEVKYKGFDLALGWKDTKGDFSYEINTNLSFTRSKIIENNEGFKEYEYLSAKGNSENQVYGLEADGFFNSQSEINNSPVQSFYTVSPGDIKYKDQNGDNVINNNDVVKMYAPSLPELYYGFNFNIKYKKISLYANFQGVGNYSVNILNSSLYKPLVNNNTISDTFLENEIFWSPGNSDKATMPRLTTLSNSNNYRNSSLWYRNASYLKLRDLRISYKFENLNKLFSSVELYISGNNLFSIDDIDFADPEGISDSYPSLRSYWAGINVKF